MSEASRARRQALLNRLEELAEKHGPVEDVEPEGTNIDPSWGAVGALARQVMSPDEFSHLLQQRQDMLARDRARKATYADAARTTRGESKP